jgi:hypothetical protein
MKLIFYIDPPRERHICDAAILWAAHMETWLVVCHSTSI